MTSGSAHFVDARELRSETDDAGNYCDFILRDGVSSLVRNIGWGIARLSLNRIRMAARYHMGVLNNFIVLFHWLKLAV